MTRSTPLYAILALAPLTQPVSAAFLTPNSWTPGDPYTTRQHWDIFQSPLNGTNPADLALANPNGAPNLINIEPGAFVTSGGNIYSFSNPIRIETSIPQENLGLGYVTTLLLQIRTQGTEIDWSTANVAYTDNNGIQTVTPFDQLELARIPLGGFGGALVDHAAVFHIPFSPASLLVRFNSLGSSSSLDQVLIDTVVTRADASSQLLAGMNEQVGFVTTPIPEPATLALLGLAAAILRPTARKSARPSA